LELSAVLYIHDLEASIVLAYLGQTGAFHVRRAQLEHGLLAEFIFSRIMARPINPDGNKFGVGITGLNFDPRDLADEGKAKEFIREQTGRADLEFGDFSWLSYFRFVFLLSRVRLNATDF
jgi:hypothetical protein